MTVMDKLQSSLIALNMPKFFDETRKELDEYGVIIFDPHNEDKDTFKSIVGILGDSSTPPNKPTIDTLKEESFIKLGTAEVMVHAGRGVSLTFFANPSGLFSYISYSILRDNKVQFADGIIECDIEVFVELVVHIQEIKRRLDRALNIEVKKIKKTYISKCRTMIDSISPGKDILTVRYEEGWTESLKKFLDFMERLD